MVSVIKIDIQNGCSVPDLGIICAVVYFEFYKTIIDEININVTEFDSDIEIICVYCVEFIDFYCDIFQIDVLGKRLYACNMA